MQDGTNRRASELSDEERAYAISHHDQQDSIIREYRSAAIEVSNLVVRALLTLNGGAAIAFATVIAAATGKPEIFVEFVRNLRWPLVAFASGSGLAVATGVTAYLTHSTDAAAAAAFRRSWEHPYLYPDADRSPLFRRARAWNWLGIVLALLSLGAFFAGVFLLADAFQDLPAGKASTGP